MCCLKIGRPHFKNMYTKNVTCFEILEAQLQNKLIFKPNGNCTFWPILTRPSFREFPIKFWMQIRDVTQILKLLGYGIQQWWRTTVCVAVNTIVNNKVSTYSGRLESSHAHHCFTLLFCRHSPVFRKLHGKRRSPRRQRT